MNRRATLIVTAIATAVPAALVAFGGQTPRPAQAGVAEAQLYPSWTSAKAKCTGKKKKIRCRLTGELHIVNDGDAASAATKVDIWVSRNDVLDKEDVKVKTLDVESIPAGDEQKINFSFSAPRGTKVLKRYLIAVVDPKNVVSELDEEDNEEAIGPLR